MFKRDTHKPAPVRIPTFKSEELEYAIKSYDWNLLEDPSEDYDLLSKGLLKCASSSREAISPSASRLNAHAIKLLEQRRAVKLKQGSSIKSCKRDLCDQKAIMSALMDKDGTTQTSRRAMEAIVQEFYTDLFRSSTTVPKCLMPPAEEVPPILESEVAHAIRRMKPGTAPGPDGISADLLRAGGSALCSLLAKHFNHYLRLGRIPDSWKESKAVLIFKKGHEISAIRRQ
ncbi:unnamed protein product [Heligmosomoides polygyrus]|uniref:Reverse transcriptase domain-containing protein n=1 Tax=Heligmosomoides polygyrus TaxID=6339 RepID=A0A183FZY8_HELPZ|nr:unnamed protein product [Heligmosomoides polygyrus]